MMQDETRETAPHPFVTAVHGIRYQVKDVARSTAFYTDTSGLRSSTSNSRRSRTWRLVTHRFCSVVPAHRAPGRCRTDSSRSRAGGIAWC